MSGKLARIAVIGAVWVVGASAHAVTVDVTVSATDDSRRVGGPFSTSAGSGQNTGVFLNPGDSFSVTVDPSDEWVYREGLFTTFSTNADGSGALSFADGGLTAPVGALVGEIDGTLFLIGTSFSGVAAAAGELILWYWDSNNFDNAGSVLATVTAVPLPAGVWLFLSAMAGLFALVRRRRMSEFSPVAA